MPARTPIKLPGGVGSNRGHWSGPVKKLAPFSDELDSSTTGVGEDMVGDTIVVQNFTKLLQLEGASFIHQSDHHVPDACVSGIPTCCSYQIQRYN